MILDLTAPQIQQLVGTRHAATGVEFPPVGLQPYHDWLIRTLHHLAESSCGALRVVADDAGPTVVRVLPGRATLGGVAVDFAGGTLDLAPHNNATVLLWLHDDAGAAVGVGALDDGWPAAPHVKLAGVTLAAGVITALADRRFESLFAA